jgi:signal transduction histidine kinase
MDTREPMILLVSDNAALCAAARRELESLQAGLRVAAVSTVEAARRILADAAPTVILLEDPSPEGSRGKVQPLDAAVSSLMGYAPVVVIGDAGRESEIAALIAAGAADYVPRTEDSLPAALRLVESRLRRAQNLAATAPWRVTGNEAGLEFVSEDFGEVLRHELNNPLTGILGNAELLLAEVMRKNDGKLPEGGKQRIETIAALAVRLRETVRRLSIAWEIRHSAVH